jgi:hypothetical protein
MIEHYYPDIWADGGHHTVVFEAGLVTEYFARYEMHLSPYLDTYVSSSSADFLPQRPVACEAAPGAHLPFFNLNSPESQICPDQIVLTSTSCAR